MIPIQHSEVPPTSCDYAIGIDTKGHLAEERLQQTRVAFPPEIDVTALNLPNERFRRHCTQALCPMCRLRPAAHGRICEDEFANRRCILRIQPHDSLVSFKCFLPFTLPASDRCTQTTDVAIVWG